MRPDIDLLRAYQMYMSSWKADLYLNKTEIVNNRVKINPIIQHHVKYNLARSFIELPLECMGEVELKSLFEIYIEHVKEMLGDGDGFNFELIKQIFQSKVADKRF